MGKCMLVIEGDATSIKAFLVDENGKEKVASEKKLTKCIAEHEFVEIDANEIWISTMYVILDLVKTFSIDLEAVDVVGVKRQLETLVIWDKNTEIPICPVIYKSLEKQEKNTEWIFEKIDGTKEKEKKEELISGTVTSWIAYRMTGEYVLNSTYTFENKVFEMYGYTDSVHFFGRELPVIELP